MKTGLKKLFLSTNEITWIIGDRTYITRLPQGADESKDHIILTQISSDEHKSLDGTSELRFLDFDIDCKAQTAEGANTLAKAVRTFLKDYTGPAGDQEIKAVIFNGESDGIEPPTNGSGKGLHVALLDFQIQYQPV